MTAPTTTPRKRCAASGTTERSWGGDAHVNPASTRPRTRGRAPGRYVERAGAFTREGLADARRAVLALRDGDAAMAAPRPLADQLRSLAREYGAAGDTAVSCTVSGEPRPVAVEAALTVYRTAQEALTNARKHAPGQPVSLTLEFTPSQVTVDILNPLPPAGAVRPLAAAGTGYGLIGLQERAALGGGSLIAGPAGGQWRVTLKMPA